jgi:hypothetical protein
MSSGWREKKVGVCSFGGGCGIAEGVFTQETLPTSSPTAFKSNTKTRSVKNGEIMLIPKSSISTLT